MKMKILAFSITILTSGNIYALNTTIINANNQAYIDGLVGYDKLKYSANHPGDAGAPVFNATSVSPGIEFGLTKMFGSIYSQFSLGANHATLHYSDVALNNLSLSNGNLVTLSIYGRLGYSFTPQNFAITPYLVGGYINNQLNTGGYSSNFLSTNYNGATLRSQTYYYGLGLLNQWAATTLWVLSVDGQFGTQYHPWVNGNVNNFNNQVSATTTYQQWNLSRELFWQLGLGSDYLIGNYIHFRAGASYGNTRWGGENTIYTGIFPSQNHSYWLWKLGLGYDLSDTNILLSIPVGGNQEAMHAANNQASLQAAYQYNNFSGGTSFSQFHQKGAAPSLSLIFSKTWKKLYAQIALSEAAGNASYSGQAHSTTNNTYLDASGKLGYQFESSHNTAITPYATIGYHRWSQDFQGVPTNESAVNGLTGTYFTNGFTQTYQHGWYGAGLLAQWAALTKLVLSFDVNLGYTFNPSLHSWTPLGLPVSASYSLGNAGYQKVGVGADYLFGKNWHVQMNLNYWHYRYGSSSVGGLGISSLNDNINQVNAMIGIGYSFA